MAITGIERNTIEFMQEGYLVEVEIEEAIDDLKRQVNLERREHDGFISTDEMHDIFDEYFTDYPELKEWHEPLYEYLFEMFDRYIEDDEEREEREENEYRGWVAESRELMRGYIHSVV